MKQKHKPTRRASARFALAAVAVWFAGWTVAAFLVGILRAP